LNVSKDLGASDPIIWRQKIMLSEEASLLTWNS